MHFNSHQLILMFKPQWINEMMVIRRDLIRWGNGSRPQVFLLRYSNPMVCFFRFPGFFYCTNPRNWYNLLKKILFFSLIFVGHKLNYFFNMKIYLNVVNVFLVEKN